MSSLKKRNIRTFYYIERRGKSEIDQYKKRKAVAMVFSK